VALPIASWEFEAAAGSTSKMAKATVSDRM